MVLGDIIFHLGSWGLPLHLRQAELNNSLEDDAQVDPTRFGSKVYKPISDTSREANIPINLMSEKICVSSSNVH